MKTTALTSDSAPREIWSVVVVYEDLGTRERAMAACDQLINQFWPEIEFKFLWWRTDFLEDDSMAMTAAENASESDFVIFCGGPQRSFTPRIKQWFKSWSQFRNGRDMALLDLTDTTVNGHTTEKKTYLREIAKRGQVEYLTNTPSKGSPARFTTEPVINPAPVSSVFEKIQQQPNTATAQLVRH